MGSAATLDHMFEGPTLDLKQRFLALAANDLSGASDVQLMDIVTDSEVMRSALDAFQGRALASLESRGVCDRDFGMPTATWFAHFASGDRRVAATRVNVAVKLHGHLA